MELLDLLSPIDKIEKALKIIHTSTTSLINENRELRKELAVYSKDAEIVAKNEEIDSLHRHSINVLNDIEYERQKEFMDQHYKSCKNGNHFIFDLYGTGIGTVIKIKCPVCGTEEDITDIDSW